MEDQSATTANYEANMLAMAAAVVDLPTPPFRFTTRITRGIPRKSWPEVNNCYFCTGVGT